MESPILSAHSTKSHNNTLKLTASVLNFLHIYGQRTACECIGMHMMGNLLAGILVGGSIGQSVNSVQ